MNEQESHLGPLRLRRTAEGFLLSLPSSEDAVSVAPPDVEQTLSSGFERLLAEPGAPQAIELDLNGAPAISSRQLGLMIAIQKSVRPRVGRLRVRNASESVRRLLEVTNTAQFFELR